MCSACRRQSHQRQLNSSRRTWRGCRARLLPMSLDSSDAIQGQPRRRRRHQIQQMIPHKAYRRHWPQIESSRRRCWELHALFFGSCFESRIRDGISHFPIDLCKTRAQSSSSIINSWFLTSSRYISALSSSHCARRLVGAFFQASGIER